MYKRLYLLSLLSLVSNGTPEQLPSNKSKIGQEENLQKAIIQQQIQYSFPNGQITEEALNDNTVSKKIGVATGLILFLISIVIYAIVNYLFRKKIKTTSNHKEKNPISSNQQKNEVTIRVG